MIVGPTVLMVRNGTGTPAAAASSVKISWSIIVASRPPYSAGQLRASQPTRPGRRNTSREAWASTYTPTAGPAAPRSPWQRSTSAARFGAVPAQVRNSGASGRPDARLEHVLHSLPSGGTVAEAYLAGAVRTPVGRRGGGLSGAHPADLGAH